MDDTREYSLYRQFDKAGNLLYVGISRDLNTRLALHRKRSPWGQQISVVTVERIHGFGTAIARERDVIVSERPLWNKTHKEQAVEQLADPAVLPLTSKQRWEQWAEEYSLKKWFSFSYDIEDDGRQFEAPIFSLEGPKDFSRWSWKSKDGSRSVDVTPGAVGRATQHDKDILIYIISYMIRNIRSGGPRSATRTVRIDVHNYLMSINKMAGPTPRARMTAALCRLEETRITESELLEGLCHRDEFPMIESWKAVDVCPMTGKVITLEITLSPWLLDIAHAGKVFPLSRSYFQSRSPLLRRLYEVARENFGPEPTWIIQPRALFEKTGAANFNRFARELAGIYTGEQMIDHHMKVDWDNDWVRIYPKAAKKKKQAF